MAQRSRMRKLKLTPDLLNKHIRRLDNQLIGVYTTVNSIVVAYRPKDENYQIELFSTNALFNDENITVKQFEQLKKSYRSIPSLVTVCSYIDKIVKSYQGIKGVNIKYVYRGDGTIFIYSATRAIPKSGSSLLCGYTMRYHIFARSYNLNEWAVSHETAVVVIKGVFNEALAALGN